MNEQEKLWSGEFGKEYLSRNRVDWKKRVPFWKHIHELTKAETAFELGCNAGWNMLALEEAGVKMAGGIDINEKAAQEARNAGLHVRHGGIELCSELERIFDLSFTSGVLIHVAPENLHKTMTALVNTSRRYVLAIEYFAEAEEELTYRGKSEALWKRPYGHLYADMGLSMVDVGDVGPADGFDDCRYWLMERQ